MSPKPTSCSLSSKPNVTNQFSVRGGNGPIPIQNPLALVQIKPVLETYPAVWCWLFTMNQAFGRASLALWSFAMGVQKAP